MPQIAEAFPGSEALLAPDALTVSGDGTLASYFAVTDLAAASVGTAGLQLSAFAAPDGHDPAPVDVDRRLAGLWFGVSIDPITWSLPPVWDSIAGDYPTADGWIRLHTNAPHHRRAAQSVLGPYEDRDAMAPAVAGWQADDLETAVVEAGGCAAAMRSMADWQAHANGAAVAAEPLVAWQAFPDTDPPVIDPHPEAPLTGLRILDLTRVLAGPVAGRFLAAFGADVLRIDPPDWEEPAVVPDVTLGKRCAGLDLKSPEDRAVFDGLLQGADVLLHGYRPGALPALGLDAEGLRAVNPDLIDVSLDAFGWSGPWAGRRGFDSLVQMSTGIAEHGMRQSGADRPFPLPVQALDHATGYLMAAAVMHALNRRRKTGAVLSAKLSLARTAHLLVGTAADTASDGMPARSEDDLDPRIEHTAWGPARRVRFPLSIPGVDVDWRYPAGNLRTVKAVWRS
ncbi:MAG: CoA transferase [Pseudomonadota bacterium]